MANVIELRDRSRIEAHYRRNVALHLYELGDLDPFFWPRCRWFGLETGDSLRSVILLYDAPALPCVLALGRDDDAATAALFEAIQDLLPDRYYAHLAPGLAPHAEGRVAKHHGDFLKMQLVDPEGITSVATPQTERVEADQREAVQTFYAGAYPGNWFDQRMLETRQYFGVRVDGRWAAIAGIHVYSPQQRVAALGNIATAPPFRGQGLGRQVTARVCSSLLREVDTVGLNVKADNDSALRLYRRLGFEIVAPYEEWSFGPS